MDMSNHPAPSGALPVYDYSFWSEEEVALLKRYREEGKSRAQIAKLMKRSFHSVKSRINQGLLSGELKHVNTKQPLRNQPRNATWTKAEAEIYYKLRDQGAKLPVILEAINAYNRAIDPVDPVERTILALEHRIKRLPKGLPFEGKEKGSGPFRLRKQAMPEPERRKRGRPRKEAPAVGLTADLTAAKQANMRAGRTKAKETRRQAARIAEAQARIELEAVSSVAIHTQISGNFGFNATTSRRRGLDLGSYQFSGPELRLQIDKVELEAWLDELQAAPWSPKLDLLLAEGVMDPNGDRGRTIRAVAEDLGLSDQSVVDRFLDLSAPVKNARGVVSTDGQVVLLTALRRRAEVPA